MCGVSRNSHATDEYLRASCVFCVFSLYAYKKPLNKYYNNQLVKESYESLTLNISKHPLQQNLQRLVMTLASFWRETSPVWTGVDGSLYNFTSPPLYSELYQRATHSPAIASYANDARLKKAELVLAQTQSSTDISWQIGVRRFEETGDNALTAGVSIPLFSGHRNAGEIKSARAAYDEVAFSKQSGLAKLHVQLYDAYSQYQQHVKSVRVYQQTIIPALVSVLSETEQAYQAGRYRYQDWIVAQEELLTAKRALIDNAAAASLNQAIIEQLIAEPL
jgi:cobalt-zinc-cadmium efflux system outer membrane protein